MKRLLGELIKEVCEKTTVNDQYPVLTSSKSGIFLQGDYFTKNVASRNNIGYKVIRKGQFTYRSMSDTGDFFINCLTVTDIGIVSPAYPVFEIVDESVLLREYLIYFFKSSTFNKRISALSKGSTRLSLKFKDLKNIEIDLPPIEEQRRIATNLIKISEVIDKTNKKYDDLDELLRVKFIEMFGTIDLKERSSSWHSIESLTEIITGTTPPTNDLACWNGRILWVTPAEMENDSYYVFDTKKKITEKGLKSKLMPVNTVLLSTRAPIGKVGLVGKPMACNQGFKNFVCGPKLNHLYLYELLKENSEFLNSLGTGTTFLELSKAKIGATKIPLPNIKDQERFAAILEKTYEIKENVKKQLNSIEELFKIKMEEYFE